MMARRKQQLEADGVALEACEQELKIRQEAVRIASKEVAKLKRKLDAHWQENVGCAYP